MDTYVAGLHNNTEFFSTCHPEMIEGETLKYLREIEKVEPEINSDKYKVKFTLVSKAFSSENENADNKALDVQVETTDITMKISRVDSETVCVEFKKTSGDQM